MCGPQTERQVYSQDEHDKQDQPELVGRDIWEGPTSHYLLELGDERAIVNPSRENEDSGPYAEEELGEYEGCEDGECEKNEWLPPGT